jgi:hypothetical protein
VQALNQQGKKNGQPSFPIQEILDYGFASRSMVKYLSNCVGVQRKKRTTWMTFYAWKVFP